MLLSSQLHFVYVAQYMTLLFIASFLLYFIDKTKRNDKTAFLLAAVDASLIAFLMISRLEFTILFLSLLIAVGMSGKIDKPQFYVGAFLVIVFFLLYGNYDMKDATDLIKTLTTCNVFGCSRPIMFLLLIFAFAFDEYLHDKFPERYKSRVLFPFMTFFLLLGNIIGFDMFACFLAFDFGYAAFRFTKVE